MANDSFLRMIPQLCNWNAAVYCKCMSFLKDQFLSKSQSLQVCVMYIYTGIYSRTVMQEWPFTTETQGGLWVICCPQEIHFFSTYIYHPPVRTRGGWKWSLWNLTLKCTRFRDLQQTEWHFFFLSWCKVVSCWNAWFSVDSFRYK